MFFLVVSVCDQLITCSEHPEFLVFASVSCGGLILFGVAVGFRFRFVFVFVLVFWLFDLVLGLGLFM